MLCPIPYPIALYMPTKQRLPIPCHDNSELNNKKRGLQNSPLKIYLAWYPLPLPIKQESNQRKSKIASINPCRPRSYCTDRRTTHKRAASLWKIAGLQIHQHTYYLPSSQKYRSSLVTGCAKCFLMSAIVLSVKPYSRNAHVTCQDVVRLHCMLAAAKRLFIIHSPHALPVSFRLRCKRKISLE